MLVRDAMLPNPLTVKPETSVAQFVDDVLGSNQTAGVVVNERGKLLGVVSVLDVFRRILPKYVDLGENLASMIHEDFFDEAFARLSAVPVSSVMTREVQSLAPDEGIMRAVKIFVFDRFKTIPVIKDGLYVGSVTRRSVLRRVINENA